jgi:hypothetical protein
VYTIVLYLLQRFCLKDAAVAATSPSSWCFGAMAPLNPAQGTANGNAGPASAGAVNAMWV